jgi:hypothetical protein
VNPSPSQPPALGARHALRVPGRWFMIPVEKSDGSDYVKLQGGRGDGEEKTQGT